MYWLTVDDMAEYNPDNPEVDLSTPQVGAAFYDVGEWLVMLGAYKGMTLDGGKSTAMARTDNRSRFALMSHPRPRKGDYSGVERLRCVGNYLGVQTIPILNSTR
jgi:hypothetical protein